MADAPHLFSLSRHVGYATTSLDGDEENPGPLNVPQDAPPFDGELSVRLQVRPGDAAVFEFDFVRVRVAIDPPAEVKLLSAETKL